jgi:cobalt/nickel transport system permease protein
MLGLLERLLSLGLHIPDGFLSVPVAGLFWIATIAAVAIAVRRCRSLDERQVPLVGVMAACIFAAQMLNFPVLPGVSGHLLGGALAAILVGPWTGALCLAIVLVVQALMFADGGLSALGLNVLNMALIGTFAAYLLFVALRRLMPSRPGSVVVASGVAAGLSVVVASAAFTVEYALGGAGGASVSTVAGAMVGVHTLIGIGEGIITGLVVSAVLATRPDLVWGARGLDVRAPSGVPAATGDVREVAS